jgi:hypothetical protein
LAGVAGLVRRGGACPEPRASSLFCVEEMLSLRWTLGGAPGRSAGSASLHGSGGRGRGGGQSSGVGSGEDPQARVVRMPRSVAEEVAASLAARPHSPEVLVFTAPLGGPAQSGRFRQKLLQASCPCRERGNRQAAEGPAPGRAAGRPALLRPSAYLCQPAHPPGREHQGGAGAAGGMRPPASPSTPTGTCSRPRWRRSLTAWRWCGMPPWRSGHGPSTDQRTTAWGNPQVDDLISWRRLRGSNPRGSCPPTRFPGVCLRPLGQASAGQCTPRESTVCLSSRRGGRARSGGRGLGP